MRLLSYIVVAIIGAVIGSYLSLYKYLPASDTVITFAKDNIPYLENVGFVSQTQSSDVVTEHQNAEDQITFGGNEILTSVSPSQAETMLESQGWQSEIFFSDDKTSVAVLAVVGEINIVLSLRNCADNTNFDCETLLFFANFDLDNPITGEQQAQINNFNDSNLTGRAYYTLPIDETPPRIGLDMRISLKGGVTKEHLVYETLEFKSALDTLLQKLGE